jgi:hypothetical protein
LTPSLCLFAALDAQRQERGLSWSGVAREIWELSAELNARRRDHPIRPSTLTGMAKRGDISCQHALFMLRWLGRSPESFLRGATTVVGAPLPAAGPDQRLRWNLHTTPRRRWPGNRGDHPDGRRRGRLDIVVNSAGVLYPGPVIDAPPGEWDQMIPSDRR